MVSRVIKSQQQRRTPVQPHVTPAQAQAICRLALAAIGVLNAVPSYGQLMRSSELQQYVQKLQKCFSVTDLPIDPDESVRSGVHGGSQTLQPLWQAVPLADRQFAELACFIAASYLRVSMGFDGKGDDVTLHDPAAAQLLQVRVARWDHIDDLMAGYMTIDSVFPPALANNPQLVQRLTYWLTSMLANGISTALQTFLLETTDYAAMPRLAPTRQSIS